MIPYENLLKYTSEIIISSNLFYESFLVNSTGLYASLTSSIKFISFFSLAFRYKYKFHGQKGL